jgi:hypothetical protein
MYSKVCEWELDHKQIQVDKCQQGTHNTYVDTRSSDPYQFRERHLVTKQKSTLPWWKVQKCTKPSLIIKLGL